MLAALRAGIDDARRNSSAPTLLAEALIALAEVEPIFAHRQAIVRGLLEEAAKLVDKRGREDLEGRVLLRLAYIKLVDVDLEGAEQLARRARTRLAGDTYRVLEAGVVLARAAIRRHEFNDAERALVNLGMEAQPETTPLAAHVAAQMALAWAELALEQQDYRTASERLRVVEEATRAQADEDAVAEVAFTARQMTALVDIALERFIQACAAMRDAVAIAKRYEAHADEIEARLGLAGALGERGEPVNLEEAEKHLQIARDRAIEHGLDSQHMAALVAQAGLLARKGQTRAALDRCLEIAQAAVTKGDLPRYGAAVGLMAQIYEQKGDLASSYRTYAEAHASLRESLGDQAKDIVLPYMTAFADRIGRAKFAEIADQVNKASHARSAFQRDPGKNNG